MLQISNWLLRHWISLMVFAIGWIFFGSHIVGWEMTHFPGDLGDGRFNMYCLEHSYRFLIGDTPSFWNAPFMYPEEGATTFSESLVGTAPIYGLFRLIGCDRELAYQWWYVAIVLLNFFVSYAFLYAYFKNAMAASMGAFLFAFGLVLQSQMTHAQTFPRFAAVWCVWMCWRYRDSLSPKHFFLALLALVWQIYSSIYLGLMMIPVFAIMVLTTWIKRRKDLGQSIVRKSWWTGHAFAVVLNAGLLLLLMYPYYLRSKLLPGTPKAEIFASLPTFKSYFFSQNGSLLWDAISTHSLQIPCFWDHQLFPGLTVVLAMILASVLVCSNRTKQRFGQHLWIIGTMWLVFILFLRIGNFSIYELLYHIPGFKAMRALQRIVNIELIFWSWCLSLLVTWMMQTISSRAIQYGVGVILFAFIVADNYMVEGKSYHTMMSRHREEMRVWGNEVSSLPRNTIVSFECIGPCESAVRHQLSAMCCAQEHYLRTTNGYTSTSPGGYADYWNQPDSLNRMKWLNFKGLSADSVVSVVVKFTD